MNLRTIKLWAVYQPATMLILDLKKFKKDALRSLAVNNEGCVLVMLKGHYLPPRKSARGRRKA